ncbi:MAG: hypothetical protein P4L84_22935 [Isosphaeraceae bacterium]|nr:hypothetical protein [Isosphaeraceae bacterium]
MARPQEAIAEEQKVEASAVLRGVRLRALGFALVIALIWGGFYRFSMAAWPIWVGTIGIFVGLPWALRFYAGYLLAPVRIHDSLRHPVLQSFTSFAPTEPDVLPEARTAIQDTAGPLSSLGFTLHGHRCTTSSTMATVTGYVSLWENKRLGEEARVITTRAHSERKLPDGRIVTSTKITTVFLIASRFADGTKVVTASSEAAANFRRDPSVIALNYPQIRDIERLHRIHRRAVEHLGSLARVEPPRILDPAAYLAQTTRAEWQRQVDGGEAYVDEADGTFRATWKGAILMALRLRWPWRQWRRWSLARRSQQFLDRFPELLEPSPLST